MPAQIIHEDSTLLGPSTFTLHTAQEAAALVEARAGQGRQTLVFTHRADTAAAVARQLRVATGRRVATVSETTPHTARVTVGQDLRNRAVDVVVLTDRVDPGWRASAGAQVVHVELPPYDAAFAATMNHRKARVADRT